MVIELFVFMLLVLLMAYGQKAYFDAIARSDPSQPSLVDAGLAGRAGPREFISSLPYRTVGYLRLLARRQKTPDLDRRRWLALSLTALVVATFLWIVFN